MSEGKNEVKTSGIHGRRWSDEYTVNTVYRIATSPLKPAINRISLEMNFYFGVLAIISRRSVMVF